MSRQLQSVYREILSEPVPERFLRLIDKLDGDQGGS
jgi:Anti-sigma factor NepR